MSAFYATASQPATFYVVLRDSQDLQDTIIRDNLFFVTPPFAKGGVYFNRLIFEP
jgi:hypothetical protein